MVATDNRGNIMVLDKGNNRIQFFTPDMEYICSLSTKSPKRVAVMKNDLVVVTSWDSDTVNILRIPDCAKVG